MNISCAFPQHQSPPRGRKAITSQSYGFFPFAVFFLISLSFATAEKKIPSKGREIKIKFSYATAQLNSFWGMACVGRRNCSLHFEVMQLLCWSKETLRKFTFCLRGKTFSFTDRTFTIHTHGRLNENWSESSRSPDELVLFSRTTEKQRFSWKCL